MSSSDETAASAGCRRGTPRGRADPAVRRPDGRARRRRQHAARPTGGRALGARRPRGAPRPRRGARPPDRGAREHAYVLLPRRDPRRAKREEQLEHTLATIENIGRAGIPIFGFHWMANEVWRSELAAPGRGGARVTVFDAAAVPDRDIPTFDRVYTEDEIWESFVRVHQRGALRLPSRRASAWRCTPTIRPVPSIGGVGRPFRSFDGLRRAVEHFRQPVVRGRVLPRDALLGDGGRRGRGPALVRRSAAASPTFTSGT